MGTGKTVFTKKMPMVLYGARYAPDGTQIAITSNDNKTHFVNIPANAR
jgi:hypothetical protein